MSRSLALSGFPEWLPAQRLVESAVIDSLRHTFAVHGFSEIETRAVEPLERLLSKGETSKEVYLLHRLQEEAGTASAEKSSPDAARQLGLHFDLTVPFARYVLENAGKLVFPFRRFQIQKVWRGERPQDGRFREFTQADIDIVAPEELAAHFEVEIPLVMAAAFEALQRLGVPEVRILVNNRRLSEGFYRGLGLTDIDGILRSIDKLDKIGGPKVIELLIGESGATAEQAQACLDLAAITATTAAELEQAVHQVGGKYGVDQGDYGIGLTELTNLLQSACAQAPGSIIADLKIARGLDYYTGSVYEAVLVGHEDLGSVCSGGRYDNLASDGSKTYPGVGMSIGVSRLLSRLFAKEVFDVSRPVPTAVLVAVNDEETRAESDAVAYELRKRGIPTEVAPSAAKFGKQIKYADRRGIPYVWFLPSPAFTRADGSEVPATDHQIKDIRSGEQATANPQTWEPSAADWWPQVTPAAH